MSLLGNLGIGTQYWDEILGTAAQLQNPALAQALAGTQQDLQNLAAQAQPYYAAAVQQAAAQVAQRPPLVHAEIGREKLRDQIQLLVRALPMSIAGSIRTCCYYERDATEAARFVILFSNRRELVFYDVDKFPSAEHIGRIALECP